MSYKTLSMINPIGEDTEATLKRINNSLNNNLRLLVCRHQDKEIKTYSSSIVENIMYSENFKCYVFSLTIKDKEYTVLIDYFDVIGKLEDEE